MKDRSEEAGVPVAPTPYARRVWDDLWGNLPGLLGANLIFLLWCAPWALGVSFGLTRAALVLAPVTVGPGVVGLLTYVGRVALGEPASFWRDSLRGAGSGFVAGSALGTVLVVALAGHALALTAATSRDMALGPLALWASQVAVLLVLGLLSVHAFTLVGLYRQGAFEALRNALILSARHPMPTVGMLSVAILSVGLVRALGWGPVVIAPAAVALLAVNNTLMLVRQEVREGETSNV